MNWGHSAAGATPARSLSLTAASAHPHACRHAVQFYYDDRFLIEALSDFVLGALEGGRCAVVVATQEHRFDCAERLREKGVDLTQAIEQGRYVAMDASDTLERFMVNGSPDPKVFAEILSDIISTSSACVIPESNNAKAKVAIFGEMVALLLERGQIRAALRLEQLWNELSKHHSFELLCAYRISSFDRATHRELFQRICAEHDVVIPAEGYSQQGDEKDRLRTIALLQQAEQVLKTESVERQLAQAQNREAEYQRQQLLKAIRKHEAVEEDLRKFTRRLLTARDEEQRKIAASLHENMAQLVAALSVYFGVLHQEKGTLNPRLQSAVASSRSVSDNLLNEIRKLSRLLHPPTLDDMGVGVALKDYVDHLNRHGASIVLELAPNIGRFNRELEITVYRIVEEALGNMSPRSAGANTAVRVMRSASSLLLEIESPHAGNNNAKESHRAETRFTGIHERVMEHRGSVHFTSTPSGTLISVTLPLESRQESHSSAMVPPFIQKMAS
jgi:signal transduction histidine kinase